jgi:proline iminopeptidase
MSSMAAEIGRYVDAPGGRVWVMRCGGGPGLPLVTLHGGPGSPHDYLQPLSVLGNEREVFFYDQLGCGHSDHPDDPDLWVLDRFVEELRAVIHEVGRTPVHILGHSWGTMLAVDYALAYPNAVASLILDSPCLSMRRVREDMERLKAALPPALLGVIVRCEAEGKTDSGAYGAAAMAFYRRHVCRLPDWPEPLLRSQANWGLQVYHTMWGPAEFTPTGNLAEYEREDRLQELRCPVLYLCGRHDEIAPASTASYHRATPGSQLAVFEDSAHVKHLEEPQRYEVLVRQFLSEADRKSETAR